MFLRGDEPIKKYGRKLPHWEQGEAMQFVTFRLADALPESKLRTWRDELAIWTTLHPKPWTPAIEDEYDRKFTARIERWLDQGHGSCLLREEHNRLHLEEVLMHFQDDRVVHYSWVIMPNHAHVLFIPLAPMKLLLKAWKGVSARRIGCGSIWQKDYRDTLVRDREHFVNLVRYIRKNPEKLPSSAFTLWEGQKATAIPTTAE